MPSEKPFARRSAGSVSPTTSSSRSQRRRASTMPQAMALVMRFSRAVRPGSTPGPSMSASTERPVSRAAPSGRPKTSASPEVGVVSPQSIFMVVDLPAPLRPTNP